MAEMKRERTKNFNEFEKQLLIEITKEHEIVLSKQKDVTTTAKKEKAWKAIVERFNSNESVTRRDVDGLKACLHNLQVKAKREDSIRKVEIRKTGGGPPPPLSVSETSEALIGMMPEVFSSLDVLDDDTSGMLCVDRHCS
jgi:hypothetical protein